jgi:hypothetical protein
MQAIQVTLQGTQRIIGRHPFLAGTAWQQVFTRGSPLERGTIKIGGMKLPSSI